MKVYALQRPEALNPLWFNQVRHGHHAACVGDDGAVELDSVRLAFDVEALAPGVEVEIWLACNFVCASVADILADRDVQLRHQNEVREAERQRLNQTRAEAEAFNARIKLPARWEAGQKDVLSGLSRHSWGDGRNKASVDHILLPEPLEDGRLRRAACDFLCSSNAAHNGKHWSDIKSYAFDGDRNEYMPQVTCRACLKLAQRWTEELEWTKPLSDRQAQACENAVGKGSAAVAAAAHCTATRGGPSARRGSPTRSHAAAVAALAPNSHRAVSRGAIALECVRGSHQAGEGIASGGCGRPLNRAQ